MLAINISIQMSSSLAAHFQAILFGPKDIRYHPTSKCVKNETDMQCETFLGEVGWESVYIG